MRVLAVATALPRPGAEGVGIFIQREVEALRGLGLEVVTFEARYRHGPIRAARLLAAHVRQVRPALVHVYAGSIGALCASFATPIPLVVTYTGSDLLGAARGDPWIEQAICRASVMCSQFAARRADAIIVCSEQLRAALWRPTDRARAHVIAAGVDVDRFQPMERAEARHRLGRPSDGTTVLFGASKRRAVKRFWLAQEAMKRLAAAGVQARLETLEEVLPDDVPLHLNAADCLLLTSQHEGSPNVVKEAVACACPVVSVTVGDVAEVLAGVTPGAVVAADPAALGEALYAVLRDGRRADGAPRIRERHAAPAVAERVSEVYRRTLARRFTER